MAGKCGRCCETSSEVECTDCGGVGNGPIPLCLECSSLLHVGFMKGHSIETVEVKTKRADFKESIQNYKKKEQVLKRSLVEIKHAYQNISSRGENNKYTVQQALVAINQALKKKEEELSSCMSDSGLALQRQLTSCEKDLEKRLQKLQSCHEKADALAAAEAEKFLNEHTKMSEEIQGLLSEKTSTDIPSLNSPICSDALDVTKVLDSLRSFGAEWLTNQKAENRPQLSDSLQEIKEGDKLKGYVESRMDAKGCFWVCQDLLEGITNSLDDLSFEIRKDIITHGWEDLTVKEGSLCVAQYYHDNRWYRARVEKLKEHTAEVRWLDYAHGDEVQLSHIQPLRERFMDIPFQGLECTMFEDMSEEMPRQARWEFSDLTSNMLLECTVIKKLKALDGGKVPIYLIKLEQTGEEKQDIAEHVWNKAQDSRSSKGAIAYRDIRLLGKESKDIKVVKEVVNASKAADEKTTTNDDNKEDGEKENDEQKEEGITEGKKKEEKEEKIPEEGETSQQKKEEMKEEKDETVEGENEEMTREELCKDKETKGEEGEAKEDGEKEKKKMENGPTGEGEEEDAVKEEEDLNLAQKLEKQADSAPAQTDSVPVGTSMSPMAFIAAHGTYQAINGTSDGGNSVPNYGPMSFPLDAGWYQHYHTHYSMPSLGLPAGLPVVSPVNENNSGRAPVDACFGVQVATPLMADGTFWAGRFRGHEQELRFKRLMQDISAPGEPLTKDQLHRGKLVCAFPQDMGHWCRGKVEEIAQDVVHVRLIDFGSVASLLCKQIKALDVQHGVFPFQAIECSLAKENLPSFSEGSRQLFHQLTAGKLATVKVDTVKDFVLHVMLFVTGERGDVVDVVAELARYEDPNRGTSAKQKPSAPAQEPATNGPSKPNPEATSLLRNIYRKSPAFVADVERDMANLIRSLNNESQQPTQSYRFPPMERDQRAFVHEICHMYGMTSDSTGTDSARFVTVTAERGRSCVPSPTVSEMYQNEPAAPTPGLMDDQYSEHHRYMGGNTRGDERQACYLCGEMGHRKTNCPRNARNRDRGKQPTWWGGDGRKGRKGGGGGRR